mmetsp:Transcript_61237/g.200193  ORF Transcript_61237/g.200193 Transcript_61237/m.200193 type:complete len:164 (+) Transcript_61237:200-691(+)
MILSVSAVWALIYIRSRRHGCSRDSRFQSWRTWALARAILLVTAVSCAATAATDAAAVRTGHAACASGFRQGVAVIWDVPEASGDQDVKLVCNPIPFVFVCLLGFLSVSCALGLLAAIDGFFERSLDGVGDDAHPLNGPSRGMQGFDAHSHGIVADPIGVRQI